MQSQCQAIIKELNLQAHIEGGFFRQTYRSPLMYGNRHAMTVIHYMVTKDSPLTEWHMNKSDIVHFHHKGGKLRYFVLHQDGKMDTFILSNNVKEGENLQMMVPGNTWKACILEQGDYALISEAVSPGFDYADMTIIQPLKLMQKYPQHLQVFKQIESRRMRAKSEINQKEKSEINQINIQMISKPTNQM